MWGAGRCGAHVESVFWRGLGPARVSEEPVIRPTSQEAFSRAQHVRLRERRCNHQERGLQRERGGRMRKESQPWSPCSPVWVLLSTLTSLHHSVSSKKTKCMITLGFSFVCLVPFLSLFFSVYTTPFWSFFVKIQNILSSLLFSSLLLSSLLFSSLLFSSLLSNIHICACLFHPNASASVAYVYLWGLCVSHGCSYYHLQM